MLAGLGAGVIEATIAVTPSETIKWVQLCNHLRQSSSLLTTRTKLIQDAATAQPMYTNLVNGTVGICRTEGLSGIYRGLWPTVRHVLGRRDVAVFYFADLTRS